MTHHKNGADSDESAHGQPFDESLVRSFTVEDVTVLYDVDVTERFIQSDTAVDLTEAR